VVLAGLQKIKPGQPAKIASAPAEPAAKTAQPGAKTE